MALGTKPAADIAIEQTLVRALLQEQHEDLAHLPLEDAGEGWDNRLFRLGHDLVVRLPRRAVSAVLIEQEQRWLPQLAARVPLPIPVPSRAGRPGCGFPWHWSITPWFDGESALHTPPQDLTAAAAAVGQFLRALHHPAPDDAPQNPWRSVPLAARTDVLLKHLSRVGGLVDRAPAIDLWTQACAVPSWGGPPLWIHGDLHLDNLVVNEGRVSAVIDFGDLAAGDPATDLSVLWMLLPPSLRSILIESARGAFDPIDDHTLMRARGWALALGLAYLADSRGDEAMGALGLATITAALLDE
jgi:aminoglycoside phosphotransferase (APT) family kinase protein